MVDHPMKTRRASMSVGNAPILLVTVAITLIIGVVVIANLVPSIPTLTGTANTTVVNIVSTTYASMGLLVVSLIVLAAVAILLVVRMLS